MICPTRWSKYSEVLAYFAVLCDLVKIKFCEPFGVLPIFTPLKPYEGQLFVGNPVGCIERWKAQIFLNLEASAYEAKEQPSKTEMGQVATVSAFLFTNDPVHRPQCRFADGARANLNSSQVF